MCSTSTTTNTITNTTIMLLPFKNKSKVSIAHLFQQFSLWLERSQETRFPKQMDDVVSRRKAAA